MQNASPIRRYVLLRQRDAAEPGARWSLERIGAPREGDRAPAAARPAPRPRG